MLSSPAYLYLRHCKIFALPRQFFRTVKFYSEATYELMLEELRLKEVTQAELLQRFPELSDSLEWADTKPWDSDQPGGTAASIKMVRLQQVETKLADLEDAGVSREARNAFERYCNKGPLTPAQKLRKWFDVASGPP